MRNPIKTSPAILGLIAFAALAWSHPAVAQSGELALGSRLPLASLQRQNASGGQGSLGALGGSKGTVVVFWSNVCPWAGKYSGRLATLAQTYGAQGFGFILVNSNDPVAFPKESAAESQNYTRQNGLSVTYLMDPDGQLANAFGATRTPHVFVFDGNGTLAYVGTIDDSPGDPNNVQVQYLKSALDAIAAGNDVSQPHTKAFGCMIHMQSAGR
ncbi:MAG TPA: thioredoxin family protein [Rhodothermales bacterium]|nr:thioredoxin family protein [Rhodothermales bacterium]